MIETNLKPQQVTWKSELKSAVTSYHELSKILDTKIPQTPYPIFIPRLIAHKIKEAGKDSPLWRQFVPCSSELNEAGSVDPIADHLFSKPGGLIHRYSNRVLLSPTSVCPIQCRYCFRKNELHNGDPLFHSNISEAKNYLLEHEEVEEVILTGGDPLMLSHEKLLHILKTLSSIDHIKMIRFHSRMPVIIPSRIDPRFLNLMNWANKKFDIVSLVIHTNHISEWTPEFLGSLNLLRKTQVNLMSQTVLLKNVNDDSETLSLLFKLLHKNGVRPYYLHHPDSAKGAMHFTLPLEEGREIYHEVKRSLPGFILPHYVVELPDGNGKALAFSSENEEGWIGQSGKRIETEWVN